MPNTPIAGLRYPDLTSAPNVPLDIGNLAADLDAKVTVTAATAAARIALTSKYDGMRVYEVSTKRYYRWDAAASAWAYAGGAPPPITALSMNGTGYTAVSGSEPGFYVDASGMVHVVGIFAVSVTYTPSGDTPFFLPAGFRPARDLAIPIWAPVGPGFILGGVYATGAVKANYFAGPGQVPAGTIHTVNFEFHPGFDGGALT